MKFVIVPLFLCLALCACTSEEGRGLPLVSVTSDTPAPTTPPTPEPEVVVSTEPLHLKCGVLFGPPCQQLQQPQPWYPPYHWQQPQQ